MRYFFFLACCLISLSVKGQIHNPEYKAMLDSTYRHTVPLISVADLKKLEKQPVYILDTREAKEFKVSHLKQARHVGYFWFDMRKVYDIPYDAPVVVYCTTGARSEKIGEKLMRNGYKHVYNLYGSILEWVNEGNPVYRSNGVQTSEIHTFNRELSRWAERGTKVY